ncbi:voltage-dependent anion-selective channel-like [Homalodisca vitripennis]|nr:voltage-dependent anion-selective channel-like [Homalodisca vitripennis]
MIRTSRGHGVDEEQACASHSLFIPAPLGDPGDRNVRISSSVTSGSRQVDGLTRTWVTQLVTTASSTNTENVLKCVGVTFTEKWNTDNVLVTEVSAQDFMKGVKVSLDTSFKPQTGDKSLKAKTEFRNQTVSVNCDLDFKAGAPVVNAAAVLGYNGWLAGYSTKFDSQKSKITGNNFALGYAAGDLVFHTSVDNGQEFGGSIYHKVNPNFETAVNLAWSAGNNDTRFGIGCKYNLDHDTAVRAKVNNASQIGLSYSQKLREGVTISLSTLIDGKNFNEGGHKVGFSLELEA